MGGDNEADIRKFVFKGLVINRVPSWAKEIFIQKAQEEFADDYGQCLAYLLRTTLEYERLKELFLNNQLNVKLLLSGSEFTEEEGKETEKLEKKSLFERVEKMKGGN